jgi:hypothetical protein
MEERIRKAAFKLRRNRRQLRLDQGVSHFEAMDENYVAIGNQAVFDGVNATPEELILYSEAQYHRERTKVALLTKWALSGLATEMTMHEANNLLSTLQGQAKHFASKYPDDSGGGWLVYAAKRLYDNFSFLTRFKSSDYGYRVGPEKIFEQIKNEFKEPIRIGELVVEPTKAFLNSSFTGEERAMCSVFINLVKNSYQWSYRAGNKTTIVRLDAKTVEIMGEEYDEDNDVTRPALKHEDIIIIEDNGPGVSPGLGDSIFEPSISGRGSTGIGLHLCRAVLEASFQTIILSDEKSELGGAIFHVGRHSTLRPDTARTKSTEEPREKELADALEAMTELVEDGFNAEAVDLSDVYEEAAGLVMRIRLRGKESIHDQRLLQAFDTFDDALRSERPIRALKSSTPHP